MPLFLYELGDGSVFGIVSVILFRYLVPLFLELFLTVNLLDYFYRCKILRNISRRFGMTLNRTA